MAPLSFSRLLPAPPTPQQTNLSRRKSSEPYEISSDSDDQLEESSSEAETTPKRKRKQKEMNQCDECGTWFPGSTTHHKFMVHAKFVVVRPEDGEPSITVYRDDDGKFGCVHEGCDYKNKTTLGYLKHIKNCQYRPKPFGAEAPAPRKYRRQPRRARSVSDDDDDETSVSRQTATRGRRPGRPPNASRKATTQRGVTRSQDQPRASGSRNPEGSSRIQDEGDSPGLYSYLEGLSIPLGRYTGVLEGIGCKDVSHLRALSRMGGKWEQIEAKLREKGITTMEWWVLEELFRKLSGQYDES